MNHLIIGYGEIGRSLEKVLKTFPQNYIWRIDSNNTKDNLVPVTGSAIDVMHICFPYSSKFEPTVMGYIKGFNPSLVIIHSTVEVGTSRKLANGVIWEERSNIVYSPVRGQHPDIATDLRTYVKYIASDNQIALDKAEKALQPIRCKRVSSFEVAELAKLLSLARYGLLISFAKEQEEICKKYGVTYEETVLDWEISYNEGLMLNGKTKYIRPLIVPPKNKIGGHCVVPAMEKVSKDSKLIDEALQITELMMTGKVMDLNSIESVTNTKHVQIAKNTNDSHFQVIGDKVNIGENTKVWNFVNIMNNVEIGDNCIIGSGVEIGEGVKIGNNCKIEAGAFIPEGVEIGNNVFIGPNVVFTNDKYPKAQGNWILEKTYVEDNVSIGANSTIVCGVTLGKGSMIGAGSVVTKDVPSYEIWYGNPARTRIRRTK